MTSIDKERTMSKRATIRGTTEAWDKGELGLSEEHAQRVSELVEEQIEESAGMQAISIRLPRGTIQTYKLLAEMHGVGYQPLMRDAICRWAEGELKQMLVGAVEGQRKQKAADARTPPNPHKEKIRRAA
jgi:hypothetical protein